MKDPQRKGNNRKTRNRPPVSEQHFCIFSNDTDPRIPYTGSTMSFNTPLVIERMAGKAPGTVILRLSGPLTLATAPALRNQFRDTELPPLTILDCTAVPYVDSAGMSEIINHEVYCRDHRVRFAVAGVSPRVLTMFRITRLDQVLTLVANVEAAEV